MREFASQANSVCTLLLNGKISLEKAKAYSSVARTVAQAMSIEVTRGRFLRTMPDLTLDD